MFKETLFSSKSLLGLGYINVSSVLHQSDKFQSPIVYGIGGKNKSLLSSVTIKPPFLFLGFHSCQEQQALYAQHAAADSLNTQQNLLRDESITWWETNRFTVKMWVPQRVQSRPQRSNHELFKLFKLPDYVFMPVFWFGFVSEVQLPSSVRLD